MSAGLVQKQHFPVKSITKFSGVEKGIQKMIQSYTTWDAKVYHVLHIQTQNVAGPLVRFKDQEHLVTISFSFWNQEN